MRGRGGGGGSEGPSASVCEDEDGEEEEEEEERVSLPPCCWNTRLRQDARLRSSNTHVFIHAS